MVFQSSFSNSFKRSLGGSVSAVSIPSEFGTLPYTITQDNGRFYTSFDVQAQKPATSNTYYVNSSDGSDSNDGLSWETAFATPDHASEQVGSKTIYIAGAFDVVDEVEIPRFYDRNESIVGNIDSDVVLIGVDRGNGLPVMSWFFEDQTWAADSGAYKTSRSAMSGGRVFDTTNLDQGTFGEMNLVADAATVRVTPNSWYTDGVEVWVHTFDSRDVSSDASTIKLAYNQNAMENNGDYVTYLENISFYGGNWAVRLRNTVGTDRPELYAINCKFNYTTVDNGLDLNGMAEVYLKNCESSKNKLDGFNHSERLSYIGRATEDNCTGYANGASGGFSNNGSTIHKSGTIIRIQGQYKNNEGPNCHDIDDGTLSLCLGTITQDSRATSANSAIGFGIGSGSEVGAGAQGWYIDCKNLAGNTNYDLRVYTGNTANVSQEFPTTLNNGTINTDIKLY